MTREIEARASPSGAEALIYPAGVTEILRYVEALSTEIKIVTVPSTPSLTAAGTTGYHSLRSVELSVAIFRNGQDLCLKVNGIRNIEYLKAHLQRNTT